MMDSTTPNEEVSRQEFSESVVSERRSKYRLADLLAVTDYPLPMAEREWIDAPITGREIL